MTISELTSGKAMLTLSHNAGLAEALTAFEGGGSHLPVADDEGNIIGILSEPDIRGAKEGQAALDWLSPAPSIASDASIGKAAEKMIAEKASALLIRGPKNEVIGMVTTDDLLRYLVSLVGAEESSALESLPYSPVINEAMKELNAAGL